MILSETDEGDRCHYTKYRQGLSVATCKWHRLRGTRVACWMRRSG
jgi:hypothetical protein